MIDIVSAIMISVTAALLITFASLLYKPFLKWAELKYEKVIWSLGIPEGFEGKNILLKIKSKGGFFGLKSFKGTKIKIFNEVYTIIGLLEYNFSGEKYFLLQIEPEKKIKTEFGIRLIGFESDMIILWAELIDEKFWDNIIKKSRFCIPDTISIEFVKKKLREELEPSINLGNQKAKLYEAEHDGKIMILFGKYSMWQASCSRIKFLVNEAIHICCIYYGNELCNSEVWVGKEIAESEIQLIDE